MTTSVKRPYETLGIFISATASFEFLINTVVETISLNDKMTDHMQRQPMELRIEFLKHNLSMIKSAYEIINTNIESSNNIQVVYDTIILRLNGVMEFYNKFKPYRDLIAHSPLISIDSKSENKKDRIISSRRFKPQGKNSLEISALSQLNGEFASQLEHLHALIASIIGLCTPILGERTTPREII